jgi:hypothetical protein
MARIRRKSSVLRLDDAPPQTRVCEHPGCREAGDFRAPKSRDALNEWRWFCLDHVREYNARWDFYKGMSAEEIEQHARADATWRRPTWKLSAGGGGTAAEREAWKRLHDPLGLLNEHDLIDAIRKRTMTPPNPLSPAEREALRAMDLEWPQTQATLKSRYKELVKRHHPDANGGDPAAEERVKEINQAYATLKVCQHVPSA